MGDYNSPAEIQQIIRGLQQRVATLERTSKIAVASANPTDAVADGTLRGASGSVRLYLRVGGVWRYTVLT